MRILLVLAMLVVGLGPALSSTKVRAYVLYGQGAAKTSIGMVLLAGQLRKLDPRLSVTQHNWKDYGTVVADIRRLPAQTPVVVVGYSLGANATTWISNAVPFRAIKLVVAYDPSIWSLVLPAGPNIERALLYHNNGPDPWGHARIFGLQVETTETLMPHLAVDFSNKLHSKTLDAVRRVLKETR